MMEYPFKDLLPLDQVLEREGYYNDWTHLDPEVFYSLTQISEYIKTKGYGVDVRLLISQLAEHFGLKTTQVVDLGNLLTAKHATLKTQVEQAVSQVNADRSALETQFNQSVAQMEADKDAVIANATVDSEVILARGGKATLGQRLDDTTAQLAQIALDITRFGASPENGDNLTQINNAIDYAVANGYKYIYRPEGQYRVSSKPKQLVAPLEYTGPGFITLSTESNRVISWMDRYNDLIFGMEYLSQYHARIANKYDAKIVFSGDSTTSDGDLVVHAESFIEQAGISTVTCVNNGHSGQNTNHWLDTHLDVDLALDPNLYVLRWGINDTSSDFTLAKVKEFETNLRSGLARIRTVKTPEQMSVLLMTPNVVEFHTKDKKWGQQINSVIRKAARDYQCCFADTYMYLEDAYNNPSWMDAQLIHPTSIGDRWVVDLISDILVPNTLRTYLTNPPATTDYLKSVNDLPSTYPLGVSIFRTPAGGWIFNGMVTTIRQTGNVFLQINSGYNTAEKNQVAFRYGTTSSWSDWVTLSGGITVKPNTTVLLATDLASSFDTGVTLHRATITNGFPTEGMVETINYHNIAKQVLTTFDSSNTIKVRTWNTSGGTWNAWKDI